MLQRFSISKLYRYGLFAVVLCRAHPALALSLQEAIQTAFDQNPRTQTNREFIEAMEKRVQARWMNMYPSLFLNFTYEKEYYREANGELINRGRFGSGNNSSGLNLNVYRGGRDYNQAKEAEANLNAQKARFNSTNAQSPNTKGAIANLTASAYFDILSAKSQIIYINQRIEIVRKLMSAANSAQDQTQLQNQLDALSVDLDRATSDLRSFERDFKSVVTIPAPRELDDFATVIETLKVPQPMEAALEEALVKNPDLIASQYALQAANYSKEVEKGHLLPRVDLYASRGISSQMYLGQPSYGYNATTFGISLSWGLTWGQFLIIEASGHEIASAASNLVAIKTDVARNIETIYENLDNFMRRQDQYVRNLQKVERDVQELLRQVQEGRSVDINYAINLLRTYDDYWSAELRGKIAIANTKFNIQRIIGILFESVPMEILRRNAASQIKERAGGIQNGAP